jgi:hypothetical protein
MPQYSTSALPGGGYGAPQVGAPPPAGLSEGNKYDPKPADKFGDQAAGKVSSGGMNARLTAGDAACL